MDNFIDKLAQKFIAGEVIKANSAAEEKELKKLREQVAEYEKCLQEMRKLQMSNTQTAGQLQKLMTEAENSLDRITEESLRKISFVQLGADAKEAEVSTIMDTTKMAMEASKTAVEETKAAVEETRQELNKVRETVATLSDTLMKNQEEMNEKFRQADDFLHKENVKVYRNVQAVVVEEVGKKGDAIIKAQEETSSKAVKPTFILVVLAFLTGAANLVLQIMQMLGIPLL